EPIELLVAQRRDPAQLGAVALLLESRHRLPHLPDRPALERERPRLPDRLAAQVERAQAELLPQGEKPLAGAERCDPQAACICKPAELAAQLPERAVRAERVA